MSTTGKTRWAAGLAALLILAGLLAGCAQVLPTPVEPATINFLIDDYEQEYYKALIPKFNEQYPNITVQLSWRESGGGGNWDARKVTSDMLSDPSDPTLTENALDLSPFLTQSEWVKREDYFPGVLDGLNIEGKQVALPYGLDPWVMYYNKALFDQRQVEYPRVGWTLTDFIATAGQLTDAETGYYGYSPVDFQIDSFFFLYQMGGRIADESGKPTFTEPRTVEAMEWYSRLFHEYQVAVGPKAAYSLYGSQSLFGSGGYAAGILSSRTAMWIGPFSMRMVPQMAQMQTGIAPLPSDGAPLTAATFEGYAISKLSKQPEASWKWIAFLAQEMPMITYPARRSLAESAAFDNLVGAEAAQGVRDAMQTAILANREMAGPIGNKMNILVRVAEQIANGEVGVEQALNAAQILAENSQ